MTTFVRPSLGRLTLVELRKMADTRAGAWLIGITLLCVVLTVVIGSLVSDDDVSQFRDLFEFALFPMSIFLPVLGILSVTSEWSQRTALTTFSLVPNRERVVGAKVLAACALGAAGMAVCLLAAAIGNLFIGESWAFGWSRVGNALLFSVLAMLGGVAFGLVFQSSPLAIVVYFVLPTVWSILGYTITALDDVAAWLDTSRSMARLTEDRMNDGEDWAKLGTSLALWLLVPLGVGLWRLRRGEVK